MTTNLINKDYLPRLERINNIKKDAKAASVFLTTVLMTSIAVIHILTLMVN